MFFVMCLMSNAMGQVEPGQPATPGKTGTAPSAGTAAQTMSGQQSGPEQAGFPVLPGMPDLTGTGGPLSLPSGQRYEIKPYIFATEQYTSNVFLTNTNAKSDWITTIGPGIRMALNDPSFGADITGNFGYNWYANQTKEDYWSVDGNLGLRYNPNPQLTFRVRDYIVRSANTASSNFPVNGQPAQPGNITGLNQGTQPYLRNVVEPSVDWQFSRQGSMGILYRNSILINDDSNINQNWMENTVRPYASYWFDQRNNLALDYSFAAGTYSGGPGGFHSADYTTQTPHGRYTYRFDAQMSVFADYTFVYQDNDSPSISYSVNTPSLGIVYNFNPTLAATVQAGWFWMNPDSGVKAQDGLYSNVSLTQRDRQTTYTLAFNAGYNQDLNGSGSYGNLSFYKYYLGSVLVNHLLTQRFSIGFIGTAQRNDYAFVDRNDWTYTADATAGYQLLRWLTVSGRVGCLANNSSNEVNSYDEWHAFLTLTATFDNLLK
jgi:hypothetical protein